MSGHSKWSTIKRKKALTDAKRGKLFSKISRMIHVAVKEGGANKDNNTSLRLAVGKAKQINMPSDTIERIILKSSQNNSSCMEKVRFEANGPMGSAFIVLGITDSKNRTSQTIKHALSKHGAKLAAPGALAWIFEHRGEIIVPHTKETKEEVEMAAIDGGAQDVIEEEGSMLIITKPEDLHKVTTCLEEKNIAIENSELTYHPKQRIVASDKKNQEGIERLREALEDNDDVQEVYDNVAFV